MTDSSLPDDTKSVGVWQPVVFAAMAGGMGWGIRGQYGHETGAMIAGLLVSLTLTFLLCPRAPSFAVVRAVAMGTVAMGFGGSMTYGQTVGLTHNPETVGHFDALAWGMIGLAIKGGIWIGFAGVFFGMGLGGKRYRSSEFVILFLAMVGAFVVGSWLLNSPIDAEARRLPLLYFSEHTRWEPTGEFDPRGESWGGLLFALAVVMGYAGLWRGDVLARNLGLWGLLGGAIGFPLGQSLQAFHMWSPDVFDTGFWVRLDPFMNWWNMMEITFGATMGATLGLGLWLNRKRISFAASETDVTIHPLVEFAFMAIHLTLIFFVEFRAVRAVDMFYDLGIIMGIIPMALIVGGRWWPYFVVLPITLMPIVGKTYKQLVQGEELLSSTMGQIIYLFIPMAIAISAAVWFSMSAVKGESRRQFTFPAILIASWMYFSLNYAFFHFPWPWAEWTGRTPSGIIFSVCVLSLTAMALAGRFIEQSDLDDASPQPG